MANTEEKTQLIDEAAKLLSDIALSQSGLTNDHTQRATEFVARARRVQLVDCSNVGCAVASGQW